MRSWVRRQQVDAGERPGLTTEERELLKALERENRFVLEVLAVVASHHLTESRTFSVARSIVSPALSSGPSLSTASPTLCTASSILSPAFSSGLSLAGHPVIASAATTTELVRNVLTVCMIDQACKAEATHGRRDGPPNAACHAGTSWSLATRDNGWSLGSLKPRSMRVLRSSYSASAVEISPAA